MSQYIFYKIVCEDCPEYVYIGSTKSFRHRKYKHKQSCNNINDKSHNLKLYNKIRENGGWDKWSINIIDEGNDLSLTDARIKEEELRVKYNGNLNTIKAYRSEEDCKEYYKEHNKEYCEKNKEKLKEYRENNKQKIKEYYKQYNENNREKRQEYHKNNKQKIKEYRENNKEKIKEYYKQYYRKKKEEALQTTTN